MAKRNEKKTAAKSQADILQESSKPKRKLGFQPGNEFRFKSGYDSRRNYHGRPKDHDELRELIRDVASELSTDAKYSRIYNKITRMFDSRDPRDSVAVIEHGWGKVPDKLELDDGKFQRYHEALDAFLLERKIKSDSEPEGGSR
jgi:hypothetical protein